MTPVAQMALRRIMETESRTTRFFIICNYVSRIIAPLTSRCVKYRFKPLPADAQLDRYANFRVRSGEELHFFRLQFICKSENVDVTEAALLSLVNYSDGDLRKSITRLQSLSLGAMTIDAHCVADCCGYIDDEVAFSDFFLNIVPYRMLFLLP